MAVSRISLLAVSLVLLLVVVAAPATAQGGLEATLSSSCLTARPGETVSSDVTVSLAGAVSSSQPVSLATVGSVPKDSNFTVSPDKGSIPLVAHISIRVGNVSETIGSYQLGVVARLGTGYRIVLFTLHVLGPQQTQAPECSSIGLRLPDSTFLVTLTSLGLGLLTQVVTRRFVDLGKERKMKAEVSAFNREKKEAALANDKAKVEKLKKRELSMRQAQSKVQLARTKVTFITIIPLFAVYYLMATFLGGYGAIVAVSPIPIPYLVGPNGEMVLIWWYIIGSFTISSILSKLMRTTT